MTQQDKEQLKIEIDHIFESGANEMRILEMVTNFIDSRIKGLKNEMIQDTREYLQHWEKENNPFYPAEMRWDRVKVNTFLKDYQQQLSALGADMPRRLTAENGGKALLIGEFFEEHVCSYYDADGELVEYTEKVPVSWSTIKDIYAKIVSHYGA